MHKISDTEVTALERLMDRCQKDLTPLKSFTLPGGGRINAFMHLARTVCRRAERSLVSLSIAEPVSDLARQYLNRLSDLLFVAGRHLNRHADRTDVQWRHERKK